MSRQIIDLTMPCSPDVEGITVKLQDNLPVYLGNECHAYDLGFKSHTGTYFETAAHLFRDGISTADYPLSKLMLPGVCLRVTSAERCITAADLQAAAGDVVGPDSALLVDTGGATDRYFSRDAARWMADRKVALMGSNTNRYDSGFEKPTGFFIELFGAGIPIIANIVNLHLLPRSGFTLIVLPLKVTGVCTVPCRVVAVSGSDLFGG